MIFYVGTDGIVLPIRPAPLSRLGVSQSMICGQIVNGFVSLEVEPFLRTMIWPTRSEAYQQRQIAGR